MQMEGVERFKNRRFCSLACSAVMRRVAWSDEALDMLDALLKSGFSYEKCAEHMSNDFGLGKVTRSTIESIMRRRRGDGCMKPDPEPRVTITVNEPLPEPRMDKPPGQCRYGTCRSPRQPGRDYCAEHIRTLIAERQPRMNATADLGTIQRDGSVLAGII